MGVAGGLSGDSWRPLLCAPGSRPAKRGEALTSNQRKAPSLLLVLLSSSTEPDDALRGEVQLGHAVCELCRDACVLVSRTASAAAVRAAAQKQQAGLAAARRVVSGADEAGARMRARG